MESLSWGNRVSAEGYVITDTLSERIDVLTKRVLGGLRLSAVCLHPAIQTVSLQTIYAT